MYTNKENKRFWVIIKDENARNLWSGVIPKKYEHIKNPYKIKKLWKVNTMNQK